MKNEYDIRGDIVAIKLKNRKGEEYETIIDIDDLDKVKELNLSWHLKWAKDVQSYYCKATEYLGIINGKAKYRTVHLHAVITDCHNGVVDHLNHNTLDNRKSNLVVKSKKNNCLNRKSANKNSSTGVRNVSWNKYYNKYVVQLQINGRNTIIGYFENLDEAAKFAEEKRKEYYFKK